jgi:hypothetical protein
MKIAPASLTLFPSRQPNTPTPQTAYLISEAEQYQRTSISISSRNTAQWQSLGTKFQDWSEVLAPVPVCSTSISVRLDDIFSFGCSKAHRLCTRPPEIALDYIYPGTERLSRPWCCSRRHSPLSSLPRLDQFTLLQKFISSVALDQTLSSAN